MAKSSKQKLKILYLIDYLKNETDEEHGVTIMDMINYLKSYDIQAERKSLYSDIEELENYGYDIISYKKDKQCLYALVSREFENAELKLLVDAVNASKFISNKKSRELVKKLETFVSRYDAVNLKRQIIISENSKTINENVFYNVDNIYTAIQKNNRIAFKYYEWNEKKQLVLRENGDKCNISPWAMIWDNDNYYMIAFDNEAQILKHYRVDKMGEIKILSQEREGGDVYEKSDTIKHSQAVFSMFAGERKHIKLVCEKSILGVIIDKLGNGIMIVPQKNGTFHINVDVEVSAMFYSWLFGLGNTVKIVEPKEVVSEMKDRLKKALKAYNSME